MPLTDLALDELHDYRPEVAEPDDFDRFWADTLAEARDVDGAVERAVVESPLTALVVEDVTFPGFAGDPVRAWLVRPRGAVAPLPVIVEYMGYGGGRGLPEDRLRWAASGYAHLVMDTRGQGAAWGTGGDTPDPHGSDSATPGYMTRGILAPETYYYRRLFTDGVRLVDAVAQLEGLDPHRIAVTGGSQGGGISVAVAGLAPHVRAVMPDVPFLAHFRRSVELTPEAPYTEITRYLAVHRGRAEAVFRTLSYMDGVNFARRITCPALYSVALMDGIVLPSSVFAAFNHLAADDRELVVYPYNGHEGGEGYQWQRQAAWLSTRL